MSWNRAEKKVHTSCRSIRKPLLRWRTNLLGHSIQPDRLPLQCHKFNNRTTDPLPNLVHLLVFTSRFMIICVTVKLVGACGGIRTVKDEAQEIGLSLQ